MTEQEIAADPDFQGLPDVEKQKVLGAVRARAATANVPTAAATQAASPASIGGPMGVGGGGETAALGMGVLKGAADSAIGLGGMVDEIARSPMGMGTPVGMVAQMLGRPEFDPRLAAGPIETLAPGGLGRLKDVYATPQPGMEQLGYYGEKGGEIVAGLGPILGPRLASLASNVGSRLIPSRIIQLALGMAGRGGAGGGKAVATAAAPVAAKSARAAASIPPPTTFGPGAQGQGFVQSANASVNTGLVSKLAARGTPLPPPPPPPPLPTAGIGSVGTTTSAEAATANAAINAAKKATAEKVMALQRQVVEAQAKGAVPGHGFVPKGLTQEAEQAEAALNFLRVNTQASSTMGGIQLPSVNVVEKVRRVAAEPVRQAARAAAPKAAAKSKEELMNELGSLLMKGKPR